MQVLEFDVYQPHIKETPGLGSHEGCWTSVSQRLSLKDELTMKAYSEDIDSLLTLVGRVAPR